jgi:hypothetical protein
LKKRSKKLLLFVRVGADFGQIQRLASHQAPAVATSRVKAKSFLLIFFSKKKRLLPCLTSFSGKEIPNSAKENPGSPPDFFFPQESPRIPENPDIFPPGKVRRLTPPQPFRAKTALGAQP